ncbi:PLP-dependent aminotransferase family protein [bacterium]|nr:PLP-dependent aminotransferase family protein [bacterium]
MSEHSRFNGTYTTKWSNSLAKRTTRMESSVIRELLKITMVPGMISFAGGLPAPELFPVRDFNDAFDYVMENFSQEALQYGPTEGLPSLKCYLAESMKKYDVPAEKDNILFTNGSQQALDLIGKVFINEGDKIITGCPTYLGAIQAWNAYGPEYLTVPLDENGMKMDCLEQTLKDNPDSKFIYILPNFHNPAGTTLTIDRRYKLVQLAAEYGVFIVEDDPYGELRYEAEDITPIIALHKENVIYLSTFSKTLAPGLRLGWIVAPSDVTAKLIQAKQGADLHTGTLVQYLASDICERGLIKSHIRKIKAVYKTRRDLMLKMIEEHFPKEITYTHPLGGLFLWLQLPEHVNTKDLLDKAVEKKVAFVPGFAFYPNGGGDNCLRLNFSNANEENIVEGMKRLAVVLKEACNSKEHTASA